MIFAFAPNDVNFLVLTMECDVCLTQSNHDDDDNDNVHGHDNRVFPVSM